MGNVGNGLMSMGCLIMLIPLFLFLVFLLFAFIGAMFSM